MGVIDKTNHHFSCPACGAAESVTALEKGSSYGASWTIREDAKLFSVTWKSSAFGEPHPEAIVCKTCGKAGTDRIS